MTPQVEGDGKQRKATVYVQGSASEVILAWTMVLEATNDSGSDLVWRTEKVGEVESIPPSPSYLTTDCSTSLTAGIKGAVLGERSESTYLQLRFALIMSVGRSHVALGHASEALEAASAAEKATSAQVEGAEQAALPADENKYFASVEPQVLKADALLLMARQHEQRQQQQQHMAGVRGEITAEECTDKLQGVSGDTNAQEVLLPEEPHLQPQQGDVPAHGSGPAIPKGGVSAGSSGEAKQLAIAAYMEVLAQSNRLRAAGATRHQRLPLEEVNRVKKLVSSLMAEVKDLSVK